MCLLRRGMLLFLVVVDNFKELDRSDCAQVKTALRVNGNRVMVWSEHEPPVPAEHHGKLAFTILREKMAAIRRSRRDVSRVT